KNHLFAAITHPHWTLVPAAIFREEDAIRYLKLNTGFSEDSPLSYSSLDGLECVLIYEQDNRAQKVLNQIQPALEIKHLASTILEYGRRRVSERQTDFLHVQLLDQSAIVSIFKKGSLLLANSIETEKPEDLIYYIFYTLKKLNISTEIPTEMGGSGRILSSVRTQAKKFLINLKDTRPSSSDGQLEEIIPQCA
ncbi:MAG TPA: DUF3822 family protein, partial [Cryomorphaceae bacterium]|nr:DUF3822 family protein [Cryomorphaceae bacterium]